MSAAITTPDTEQFRAFSNGSEDALAAIYRSQYDGLLALSREQLGEELAHHAPRIAQQVMLDAWQDRAKFDNPVGLVAYQEQAVSECVAVQRRKHAALHRRGDHGRKATSAAPSADEAVTQLLATLRAPAQSHDELIAEAKAAKKQHAAQHVQKVAARRSWKGPVILIGSLLVVVAAGLWYVDNRSEDIAVDKALESTEARNLSSNRGQRGNVTLNDDSKARLGAETRLRLPREFGTTLRTLELHGVAHFEVAPGKEMPFKVRAGNTLITATGTAFAVRAYEGDSVVLVSVTDGTVDVAIRGGDAKETVTSGNAVQVAGGQITPLDASARDLAMAWMRDSLVVVDMAVKDLLPELRRWYDLNPSLADPSLGDRRVSLRLALSSSGDALKAMSDSARLQIGFDKDEKVVLSDAPPKPQPRPRGRGR